MDTIPSETAAEELARLRVAQDEAERAAQPPGPETTAPLTGRQQEAAAANEATTTGWQKREAEEALANEARTRVLRARFRAEAAETPTGPGEADAPQAPRPWWARWRR